MRRVFGSVLLLSMLIVGCGGDTDSADTGGTSDTAATSSTGTTEQPTADASERKGCGWITEEEASAALGTPVVYRSNDPESSNCILDEKANPDGGLSVDFQVWDNASGYDALAAVKGNEAISGIGEKATYSPMGSMVQVAVVQNGQMLTATLSKMGGDDAELRPKAEAFARTIVAKM